MSFLALLIILTGVIGAALDSEWHGGDGWRKPRSVSTQGKDAPAEVTLLSENFDSTTPPILP